MAGDMQTNASLVWAVDHPHRSIGQFIPGRDLLDSEFLVSPRKQVTMKSPFFWAGEGCPGAFGRNTRVKDPGIRFNRVARAGVLIPFPPSFDPTP